MSDNTKKIIRLSKVMEKTGLSRSMIYLLIQRGDFPSQVKLAPRMVGWVEMEVDDWIFRRISQSRSKK